MSDQEVVEKKHFFTIRFVGSELVGSILANILAKLGVKDQVGVEKSSGFEMPEVQVRIPEFNRNFSGEVEFTPESGSTLVVFDKERFVIPVTSFYLKVGTEEQKTV